MTLPQNVKDALKLMDGCISTLPEGNKRDWQTIRAHLLSQDAEIERLQHDLSDADERSMLRSRERTEAIMRAEKVESRLAAADALLREFLEAKCGVRLNMTKLSSASFSTRKELAMSNDLLSELEEFRRLQDLVDNCGWPEGVGAGDDRDDLAVNLLRTHHAEIAAAVRDAERYRWLRDTQTTFGISAQHGDAGSSVLFLRFHGYGSSHDDVDTSIDAHLQGAGDEA